MSLSSGLVDDVIQQHIISAGLVVSQVVAFIHHNKELVKSLDGSFSSPVTVIVQAILLQIRMGTNDILKPVFFESGIGVHSVFQPIVTQFLGTEDERMITVVLEIFDHAQGREGLTQTNGISQNGTAVLS